MDNNTGQQPPSTLDWTLELGSSSGFGAALASRNYESIEIFANLCASLSLCG